MQISMRLKVTISIFLLAYTNSINLAFHSGHTECGLVILTSRYFLPQILFFPKWSPTLVTQGSLELLEEWVRLQERGHLTVAASL